MPRIVPIRSCRPGRVALELDAGLLVTELLFDRPLSRGDTLIMEFELIHAGPPYPRSGDTLTRLFRQPVGHYLAELHFHPRALPTFCRHYDTKPDGSAPTEPRDLPVTRTGHAHTVTLDTGPGACHLAWGWNTV